MEKFNDEKIISTTKKSWKLVNYCEFDKYASKAYAAIHHVSEDLNLGDITKVDEYSINDFNMMTWGFPCTDISVAGKLKGFLDENGEKTRSGMYYEGIRILREKKPAISLIENVKNLTGKKFQKEFKMVLSDLDEAGYNTYWKVLNSKHFGIPQNRERVYILSVRKDLDNGKFEFPEPFDNGVRLKDVLEPVVDEKYYLSDDKVARFIKNFKDKVEEVGNNHKNAPSFLGNASRPDFGTGYAGSTWDPNCISPTLTTMSGGNRQPHIVEKTDFIDDTVWKDIIDYPNYEISEFGDIRVKRDGYIKKQRKDKDGYLRANLYNPNGDKVFRIHQLVAKHFLKEEENMECVNHKDGNILNNHYSNLEYCTVAENNKHKTEILLNNTGNETIPRGVNWDINRQKWFASFKFHDRTIFAGRYDDKKDAYRAVFNKFVELKGYMPWDENKYKTFLTDDEVVDEYDYEIKRNEKIKEYINSRIVVEGVDKSYNEPKFIENANCITAREDRGVSNHKQEGTAITEVHHCMLSRKGEKFERETEVASTLLARDYKGFANTASTGVVEIPQATKKGFIECEVGGVEDKIRIRKLTPRECFRLQAFPDSAFDDAVSVGISNSQLYKMAGNSITCDVLYYIYRNLYLAMPYLFDDLKLSSFFSGIGAFEIALDKLYKDINSGNFQNPQA